LNKKEQETGTTVAWEAKAEGTLQEFWKAMRKMDGDKKRKGDCEKCEPWFPIPIHTECLRRENLIDFLKLPLFVWTVFFQP
jgi:hypothetical protein